MKALSRRTALQLLAGAPAAAALVWTPAEARQAHDHADAAQAQAAKQAVPFKPKFFTAHEYATVGVLVDLIIPKDERSGSATDAGPFVSNAHKNCTWTILALSMRTAEFIAQQRNQGTL